MEYSTNVGRVTHTIVDANRKEVFEGGRENRTIPTSIFYPTLESSSDYESNLTSLFRPAIKEAIDAFSKLGITEEKLKDIKTSFKENAAPLRNNTFPVVILSPGFGIDRDLYIEVITAIVQKGYIVVTVSAPYDSFFTVFPDGKVVLQAERFPDNHSQMLTRMEDIQLVLNQLDRLNNEEFFNGIFDINKIGVLGHSLGGATQLKLAAIDERIRCAILFDASLHLIGDKMPKIPVLNIRQEASSYNEYLNVILDEENQKGSEDIAKRFIDNQAKMYECLPTTSSFVKVQGASHLSFSTIGRLINDDLHPNITKTIQETSISYLEEFLKGKQGAYVDTTNNKPSNLVEIDGRGLPI